MIITDPKMDRKMSKALRLNDHLYDLTDIECALSLGHMQGHSVGNTWAVTKIYDFPKRRMVEVFLVVGDMADIPRMEAYIEGWAKGIGATLMTAVGRDGWAKHTLPGWKKTGTLYRKDI